MDKIEWIRDVIYFLPIAGLIWSAAMLASKIKQHDEKLKELSAQSETGTKDILAKLEKIQADVAEMKTDIAVLKSKEEENDRKENN